MQGQGSLSFHQLQISRFSHFKFTCNSTFFINKTVNFFIESSSCLQCFLLLLTQLLLQPLDSILTICKLSSQSLNFCVERFSNLLNLGILQLVFRSCLLLELGQIQQTLPLYAFELFIFLKHGCMKIHFPCFLTFIKLSFKFIVLLFFSFFFCLFEFSELLQLQIYGFLADMNILFFRSQNLNLQKSFAQFLFQNLILFLQKRNILLVFLLLSLDYFGLVLFILDDNLHLFMKLSLQISNFELIFAFHFIQKFLVHHDLLIQGRLNPLFFSFVLCEFILKQIILSPNLSDLTILLLIFFHCGNFSVEDVLLQFTRSIHDMNEGSLVDFFLYLDIGFRQVYEFLGHNQQIILDFKINFINFQSNPPIITWEFIIHKPPETNMDDLILCSKCQTIPYDILMMNCNHNLCIKCAVERIQGQNSTRTVAGRLFLQCEKCKSKTNLDDESIIELEKAQKNKTYLQKTYLEKEGEKRIQTPINTARTKHIDKKAEKQINKNQIKAQQPLKNTLNPKKLENEPVKYRVKQQQKQHATKIQKNKVQQHKKVEQPKQHKQQKQPQQKKQAAHQKSASEVTYGECQVHKEEPVMYYCFTCKIHCFCAECILVGKHNQHDVKVIKKAYAIVDKQFQQAIASTKKVIAELQESQKMVANSINISKNKTDGIKKIIQKSFDQLRTTIREKQLSFMKMVDQKFINMMETNQGLAKKTIESNLKEQQGLLSKLDLAIKKDEKYCLNFFADEWENLHKLVKTHPISVSTPQSGFIDKLDEYVNEVKKSIQSVEMKPLQS